MATRHHDLTDPAAAETAGPVTGEALAGYLRAQATEFLRALRLHRETGGPGNGAGGSVDAARALRRSARRITGSLHTYRPLLDADWSEEIRPELAWLSGTLALEHAYEARLERLLTALQRLSGAAVPTLPEPLTGATAARAGTTLKSRPAHTTRTTLAPPEAPAPAAAPTPTAAPAPPGTGPHPTAPPDRGNLTVGAAKAGALLERQLTLARTRAHSTALQALGSSRFHAVADKVALLASEVPLTAGAATTDLRPLATAAEERLADAVAALPLVTAGHPYNAEALVHGLSPDPAPHPQDAPWHQVRLLLRLHRYAREVLHAGTEPADVRLLPAGQALDRHRDAAEAAAAAAQAARTPRIAPATAYALGVLHADQRHEVEAARYAFQRCWQKDRQERVPTS
ncbi:CHAD domain-containing protein [Streptomyces griseosporeus]|uniref:CHAD domain-containing protein n=1 Tax=Streptomyces griseosporeus TaxID=1910 RepID=UPI00167CE606|nr:CHAD domain-containing protein [Streptomyces griseosporeus]GHF80672.1 CHAD domain-containing protein [Streptomyces griseosporeus]